MNPALQAVITIGLGVGGCLVYFYGSNLFLDKVLYPPRGPNAGRNINRANMIRPWLFLFPAIVLLGLYLAYPVVATLWLSLNKQVGTGSEFVGFANYAQMMSEEKFWESMQNNMVWLVVVPAMSTAFGLLAAQLTDRIKWGNIAKSLIFMPMAISFVGASVIWKLVYDSRDAAVAQIGALNAIWMKFEGGLWSVLFLKVLPVLLVAALLLAFLYTGRLLARRAYDTYGSESLIRILGAIFVIDVGLAIASLAQILPAAHLLLGAGVAALLAAPVSKKFGLPGIVAILLTIVGIAISLFLAWQMAVWLGGILSSDLPYGVPQQFLTIPYWNNFFLMAVLIWIQTGFAMVILSAALRGVPEDTIEAAIIDGANPFQVFFKIKVPQIMGTIVVVWTTITITVLKVFDIVLAMTNGQFQTQVLANYMYDKLFRAGDWGVGSASAMVIMLLVMPILVWNVYNARKEMR